MATSMIMILPFIRAAHHTHKKTESARQDAISMTSSNVRKMGMTMQQKHSKNSERDNHRKRYVRILISNTIRA